MASVREYAILYVRQRSSTGIVIGGGNAVLATGQHALDGAEHIGQLPIERLSTTETDTTLRLAPDGAGSVEWGLGGATDAADVNVADAGGYFAGTDVEAVLQELAAKDIGYTAHGNMGSTETFSALTGWHSGTFNADCTFTLSGATSGVVASMVLELLEDGTGTWTPTWPGSVVWPGGVTPTHDETAGTTTLYLFQSRDGGTTWYGFQAGGNPETTGHYEVLMTGASPAEPLEDGSGTDWLYTWVP